MTSIKSEKTQISASAENVYNKLSNLENLKALLDKIPQDKIPEDKREMMKKLEITNDSITIPGGPAGNIKLRMADRMPYSLISMQGENTPIPLGMQMEIDSTSADTCDVQVAINMNIPAMLKPMISGPVKKVVDQFANVLKYIPFN